MVGRDVQGGQLIFKGAKCPFAPYMIYLHEQGRRNNFTLVQEAYAKFGLLPLLYGTS